MPIHLRRIMVDRRWWIKNRDNFVVDFVDIFYSTWQISGGGQCRKACISRKKESKKSDITWKQSEPVRSILRSRKEENLHGHCEMNNARRILSKDSTLLRSCWFWSKKLHFQKNFGRNVKAVKGVKGLFEMGESGWILKSALQLSKPLLVHKKYSDTNCICKFLKSSLLFSLSLLQRRLAP